MEQAQTTKHYRFFGIELRIFFSLVALFCILSALLGFKNSIWLSMLFFLIFILLVFFIRLDSKYHLVIVTPDKLIYENVIWKRLSTSFVYIPWSEVEKITTKSWGFLNLWKLTTIESKKQKAIRVYSFMEDYLHFLSDLVKEAKSARMDKLTSDLPAGRADV
jgi:Ca2+/Na+ antiporter